MNQFPSITAFEAKYLAPKKRVIETKVAAPIDLSFLKTLALAIIAILAVDAFCLFLWSVSGQQPVDGFYAGALTANLIALF